VRLITANTFFCCANIPAEHNLLIGTSTRAQPAPHTRGAPLSQDSLDPLQQAAVTAPASAENSLAVVHVVGSRGGEQLAPPASMALPDFCASVLKTLRPGGIYATNILCRTEAGERKVVRAFRKAVVDVGFPSRGVHIATTGAPPHTNSLLFACAPGTDDSPSADKVDSATIQQTGLQQRHGQLTTLPANVAWQTWEQWDAEN
jgi:hypothetical protein